MILYVRASLLLINLRHLELPAKNIDDKKDNNPHRIDKVPVQREHMQPLRMFLVSRPAQRKEQAQV